MTKKERLNAAISGGDPDCIPCGFWSHFPSDRQMGEESVNIHNEYYEGTDVDIVKVMNEHLYRINYEILNPKDWERIRSERIKGSHFELYLEEIKRVRKLVGDDVPVLATIHGLLVSACHATDGENQFTRLDNTVTRHLKENPESVVTGLKAIAETLANLCESCVDAGADGIYYAALGGEESRFGQDFFEQYIKPLEIQILDRAKKRGLVILHICKSHVRLPMYAGYPADAVNWSVHECSYDLRLGRKIFPGIALMGGFNNKSGVLLDGTEEEIRRETYNIMKEAGRSRLILGADCTLPTGLPYDRLNKAICIMREF